MASKNKLDRYAVEFARKGGKARAKALTPEQRRQIAQRAALARWRQKGNKP